MTTEIYTLDQLTEVCDCHALTVPGFYFLPLIFDQFNGLTENEKEEIFSFISACRSKYGPGPFIDPLDREPVRVSDSVSINYFSLKKSI
jgi:hypothetical protein